MFPNNNVEEFVGLLNTDMKAVKEEKLSQNHKVTFLIRHHHTEPIQVFYCEE